MRNIVIAMLVTAALVRPSEAAAQSTPTRKSPQNLTELSQSFEDLVASIGPAVVQIFASGYVVGTNSTSDLLARRRSGGSGVILDPDGYIVTNGHVVSGARVLQVVLPQDDPDKLSASSIVKPGGRRVGAQVVGIDLETDLAVLKVEATNLPHLVLSDSDNVRQGQIVLAFGSPYGLQNSVSMGVVSSVSRQLTQDSPMIYIQTDATINPGNSGGPLIDTRGNVIGINTMILSESGGSQGVGFAIPSNIVKAIYGQFRESGRVRRGQIGVNAQTITPTLAKALGIERNWGVIIGDVYPGSPADEAGVKVGDLVLAINGKRMENGRQFDVNVYRRRVGERIGLQIQRDGQSFKLDVAVIEREDDSTRFQDLVKPDRNLIPRLGVLCIDIDDRIARMIGGLRIPAGVLIAARAADAPYDDGGLAAGDVIHAVNGRRIDSLSSLRKVIDELDTGAPVACQIERDGRLMYVAFEVDI